MPPLPSTPAKGMAEVKSLDDFLSNDKLTSLVLKADGLDPKKYDVDTLRKIFTSDPSDKKSYLNTKAESKFKEIVADFNFDTKGELTRAKIGTIQNTGAEDRTQQSFLQQTLETPGGAKQRRCSPRTLFLPQGSQYHLALPILGDKALCEVISTTYSLPKGISSMDVDKQVDLLKKFVNLDDLQDPKKVDKLMKRFTAMYDLANNSGTSTALSILIMCRRPASSSKKCVAVLDAQVLRKSKDKSVFAIRRRHLKEPKSADPQPEGSA